MGSKKYSMNQSQSRSKIIPQTARYASSGMEKYFKFKQSQVTNAEVTEHQRQIKKVKSLKNLKSCNNGVQSSKKKILRGPSPMIASKIAQKPPGVGINKQIYVKPMSARESTRYPSQTSMSTSTSTKNLMIKPITTKYDVDNPELLKKISTYYKRSYKY